MIKMCNAIDENFMNLSEYNAMYMARITLKLTKLFFTRVIK